MSPRSTVPLENVLIDGPAQATHTFLLAHGSGAGMTSDFMQTMAVGLAAELSLIHI